MLHVSTAAVRTGRLDRSCRIRDTKSGAYELYHPRLMRAELREMLEQALQLVRENPEGWPSRASFRGELRAYVVAADRLAPVGKAAEPPATSASAE